MKDKVKSLLENINREANGHTEFLVSKDTTKIEVMKKGVLQETIILEEGDDLLEIVKQLKKDYLL